MLTGQELSAIKENKNKNCNCKYNKNYKTAIETLMNNFCIFVPHTILKMNYKTPEWMNKSITPYLKKRSKLILIPKGINIFLYLVIRGSCLTMERKLQYQLMKQSREI